ncbi:hypothetical protein C7974DRAFT_418008 [Boeremia exigua]|uniref:uncharacterized protein n=1 Tax=Boeremia exigua TaxID=749465 RepID=UPI001E8D4714|nr:uncharacterized protein C7974DRAFT_418008 [Boeremia exigua]KAH6614290.1 hypothetical protein C7974DRAFT_418008 [Boeremia exigua]
MEPKEQYTLSDFKRFGRKEFPIEFKYFQTTYAASFQKRTYLDENNAVHSVNALLVGNYHKQQGPSVWAEATTTGVRYFFGNADDLVTTVITEKNVNRIYYAAPYNRWVGSQKGRRSSLGKKAGRHIVEKSLTCYFCWLVGSTNNFKYVCTNSASLPEDQEIAQSAVFHQARHPSVQTEHNNKKRKSSLNDHNQRIKQEDADTDGIVDVDHMPQSRDFSVQHSSSHPPMPHRPTESPYQTPYHDQLRNHEADLKSKLEQEKQIHVERLQDLQTKLDEKNLRIQPAEEKHMKERKKRKRAEEQVEGGQSNIALQLQEIEALKNENAQLKTENIELKRQHSNWKATEVELTSAVAHRKYELKRASAAIACRNQTIAQLRGREAHAEYAQHTRTNEW